MKFLKQIRKQIGSNILRKRMKALKRQRAFYNLKTARSIGVVFDAVQESTYRTARHFIEELRASGLDVRGLGYVKHQEMINYLPYFEGIELFSHENTNWFFYPKDVHVQEFMDAEFDILLDLTKENLLVIQFISGLSRAHLKVGKKETDMRLYDLSISYKDEKSIEEFIELVKHYFKAIKSPGELVMN